MGLNKHLDQLYELVPPKFWLKVHEAIADATQVECTFFLCGVLWYNFAPFIQ